VEGCPSKEIVIIAMGGGSVGDFAGFVASILKRGVRLVHIPSTWLAAIDSAHGGKTALNVSRIKNQIGTYYCANEIHLVKEILLGQPEERMLEAFGEVIKIALIQGDKLWNQLEQKSKLSSTLYWKLLPEMIEAKYRIVRKDPFETKGFRQLLNLGHTVGHVLESKLKMPHGVAVLYGVAFVIEWSLQRRILSSKDYYRIRLSEIGALIPDRPALRQMLRKLKGPERLLLHDKKIASNNRVRYVFIHGIGSVKSLNVNVEDVVNEIKRQSE
jgi:3-dehydroquinate synthase